MVWPFKVNWAEIVASSFEDMALQGIKQNRSINGDDMCEAAGLYANLNSSQFTFTMLINDEKDFEIGLWQARDNFLVFVVRHKHLSEKKIFNKILKTFLYTTFLLFKSKQITFSIYPSV